MEKEFIYHRLENGELVLVSENEIILDNDFIENEIKSKEEMLLNVYNEIEKLKIKLNDRGGSVE